MTEGEKVYEDQEESVAKRRIPKRTKKEDQEEEEELEQLALEE